MFRLRLRSVRQELEVTLAPPAGAAGSARGRGEWKVYADGSRKAKLSVSGLALADAARLEIVVEGRVLETLGVKSGAARYRRESEDGQVIPDVAAGQRLQIRHAGRVVLEGVLQAE